MSLFIYLFICLRIAVTASHLVLTSLFRDYVGILIWGRRSSLRFTNSTPFYLSLALPGARSLSCFYGAMPIGLDCKNDCSTPIIK